MVAFLFFILQIIYLFIFLQIIYIIHDHLYLTDLVAIVTFAVIGYTTITSTIGLLHHTSISLLLLLFPLLLLIIIGSIVLL